MKILSVSNPVWHSEVKNAINLQVDFEGLGVVPFLAHIDDCEEHGRELFKRAASGEFGEITPPMLTGQGLTSTLDDTITNKKEELTKARIQSIAQVYGTPVGNLANYESKLQRLISLTPMIKESPSDWFCATFNGEKLPNSVTELNDMITQFLEEQKTSHLAIEQVLSKYDSLMLKLSKAKSIEDVSLVKW